MAALPLPEDDDELLSEALSIGQARGDRREMTDAHRLVLLQDQLDHGGIEEGWQRRELEGEIRRLERKLAASGSAPEPERRSAAISESGGRKMDERQSADYYADPNSSFGRYMRGVKAEPPKVEAPKEEDASSLRRVFGDTAIDAAKGLVDWGESAVGLADLGTFGYAGKALEFFGYSPKASREILGELYTPQRKRANENVDAAKGFLETAGALFENPSVLIGTIAESLPSMAGIVGGARALAMNIYVKGAQSVGGVAMQAGKPVFTEAGMKAGADAVQKAMSKIKWAAAGAEGATAAGSIAEQARQAGREWSDYVLPSLGGGGATALIGRGAGALAGSKVGQRLGLEDPEFILATAGLNQSSSRLAAEAVKGRLLETAKGAARGFVQEGVLEEMPQSYGEQIAGNIAQGRPAMEGASEAAAQGLMAGGAMGAPISAVRGATLPRRAAQEQQQQQQPPGVEVGAPPGAEQQFDPATGEAVQPPAQASPQAMRDEAEREIEKLAAAARGERTRVNEQGDTIVDEIKPEERLILDHLRKNIDNPEVLAKYLKKSIGEGPTAQTPEFSFQSDQGKQALEEAGIDPRDVDSADTLISDDEVKRAIAEKTRVAAEKESPDDLVDWAGPEVSAAAKAAGLDPLSLPRTGRFGRITLADVDQAIKARDRAAQRGGPAAAQEGEPGATLGKPAGVPADAQAFLQPLGYKPAATEGMPDADTPASVTVNGRSVPATRIGKETFARLQQYAKQLYGKELILYDQTGPEHTGDGFVLPGAPKYIFVSSVSQAAPHKVVFNHELFHHLKTDLPAVYDRLKKAMRKALKPGSIELMKQHYGRFKDVLDPKTGKMVQRELTDEELEDEIISDLAGNRLQEVETWKKIFKELDNHGLVLRVSKYVRDMVGSLIRRAKNVRGYYTDNYLKEGVAHLEDVREAVAKATVEYIKSAQKTEKQAEAKKVVNAPAQAQPPPEPPKEAPKAAAPKVAAPPPKQKPAEKKAAQKAKPGKVTPLKPAAAAAVAKAKPEGPKASKPRMVEDVGTREDTMEMSTRKPWATPRKSEPPVEDHIKNLLLVRQRASTLKSFIKNIAKVVQYPNFRKKDLAKTPEQRAEAFVQHMTKNLLWLYDQIPEAIRKRSRLWYDGANKMAKEMAKQYHKTPAQMSGVIAVLSPQTDWFQNVERAKRVLDIMATKQDFAWTPEMEATLERIAGKSKNITGMVADTRGKTLRELGRYSLKGLWIRVYDETYGEYGYPVLSPEGKVMGPALNEDGSPTKLAWASSVPIAKAASIYDDGSYANIDNMLGDEHKVRNFYNNILVPNSKNGHVTIDTHAVAAALLRALSATKKKIGQSIHDVDNPEVAHNFGTGSSSDSRTGHSGTYDLYVEAYRRAAEARGMLPREMQSITWEAVRGLFTDVFKSKKANVDDINAIWENYSRGKSTQRQAQERALKRANGIANPTWLGSDSRRDEGPAVADDTRGLSGPRVPRKGAEPAAAGGRGAAPEAVPPGVVRSNPRNTPIEEVASATGKERSGAPRLRGEEVSLRYGTNEAQGEYEPGVPWYFHQLVPVSSPETKIGEVTLAWKGDQIQALRWITTDVYDQNGDPVDTGRVGDGERVVQDILAAVGPGRDIVIQTILDSALFFWAKMGARIVDDGKELTGYLSQAGYEHVRQLRVAGVDVEAAFRDGRMGVLRPERIQQALALQAPRANARSRVARGAEAPAAGGQAARGAVGTPGGRAEASAPAAAGGPGVDRQDQAARPAAPQDDGRQDLDFSKIQRSGPRWYSELQRKVLAGPNSAPASAWKGYINGLTQKGVKPEEIAWSGVTDYLDSPELPKGNIPRSDIQSYLGQNGVQLEERTMSGQGTADVNIDRDWSDDEPDKEYFRQEAENYLDQARETLQKDRDTFDNDEPVTDEEVRQGAQQLAEAAYYNDPERAQKKDIEVEFRGKRYKFVATYQHGDFDLFAPANQGNELDARGGESLKVTGPQRGRAMDNPQIEKAVKDYLAEVLGVDFDEEAPPFEQYTLPGGTNYTVQLLKLPGTFLGTRHFKFEGHFEDDNIIAHVRTKDRVDTAGKKILFLEEIQSDWAQQGREGGFEQPGDTARADELNQRINEMDMGYREAVARGESGQDLTRERNQLAEQVYAIRERVPRAPFVQKTDSWVSLVMKRMMMRAISEGYDAIAWTTGEQQADRYNLAKYIDQIIAKPDYQPPMPGTKPISENSVHISVTDKSGRNIFNRAVKHDELAGVVGKEMAVKIIKDQQADPASHVYNNLDLQVGGEGMKTFYEGIVPKVTNDVLKKLGGGKVEPIPVERPVGELEFKGYKRVVPKAAKAAFDQGKEVFYSKGTPPSLYRMKPGRTVEEGFNLVGRPTFYVKDEAGMAQPGFYITEANKASLEKGVPIFSRARKVLEREPAMSKEIKSWIGDGVVKTPVYHGSMDFGANAAVRAYKNRPLWVSANRKLADNYARGEKTLAFWTNIKRPANLTEMAAELLPIYNADKQMLNDNPDAYWSKEDGDIADNAYLLANSYDVMDKLLADGYDSLTVEESPGVWSYGILSPDNVRPVAADIQRSAPRQTETPQFKAWFKDSKVVDEKGEPLVVYHGTGNLAGMDAFNPSFTGQGNDQIGSGFYFTTNPTEASAYTSRTRLDLEDEQKLGGDQSPGVVPVFLSIQNPIEITGANLQDSDVDLSHKQAEAIIRRAPKLMDADESPIGNWHDIWSLGVTDDMVTDVARNYRGASLISLENDFFKGASTEFRQALRDILGYDGVVQRFDGGVQHWVAWFPEQIKSAIGNVGTFNPESRDILRSRPRETPEFKAWFGESKIVDENGDPLVVYHGTAGRHTVFDRKRGGQYFGNDVSRRGFFFVPEKYVAENFAAAAAEDSEAVTGKDRRARVVAAYLSIKNPVEIDASIFDGTKAADTMRLSRLIERAEMSGHDGAIVRGWKDGSNTEVQYVAFKPEQIKLTSNKSPTDSPDIRRSAPRQVDTPEFKNWFGRSKVVDKDGNPKVVYRGEHGEDTGALQTRHGSITFTESKDVAGTYAMEPNVRSEQPIAARTIPAYLRIERPVIENRDDPFIDFKQLADAVGHDRAMQIAREQRGQVEYTGRWMDELVKDYDSPEEYLSKNPDKWNELYMNAYPLFDEKKYVDWFKEEGYDGAIHIGNGESATELEYKIFSPGQARSAIGGEVLRSRPRDLAGPMRPAKTVRGRLMHDPTLIGVPLDVRSRAYYMVREGKAEEEILDLLDAAGAPNPAAALTELKKSNVRNNVANAVANQTVPTSFLKAVRDQLSDIIRPTEKGAFNLWHRTVGTQFHKAMVSPHFKKVYDLANKFMDDISMFATRAEHAAGRFFPPFNSWRNVFNMGVSKEDNALIGQALAEGTLENGANPHNGVVWTDAQLQARYKMTPDQIALFRQARAAIDQSLDDTGKALMGQMARTVLPRTPQTEEFIQSLIEQNLPLMVTRDQFIAALPQTKQGLEVAKEIRKIEGQAFSLKEHGYAPLMRFGNYTVEVTNAAGETVFFSMHETKADRERAMASAKGKFPVGHQVIEGEMNPEEHKLLAGVSPSTLEAFINSMPYNNAQQEEARQDYLRHALANRSALKRMIERKGTEGYSLDATRMLASFIVSNSRFASKALNGAPLTAAVRNIPRGTGNVQAEATKLLDYIMNPGEGASSFRGFLFFHFLGASFAAGLVNLTQPVLMTFPYLAQHGTRRAMKAMKDAGVDATAWLRNKQVSDPQLQKALERAAKKGIVEPQEIFQLMAAARSGVQSVFQQKFMRFWGLNFSLTEIFNRTYTFASAFRVGRDMGLQGDAAYDFAVKAVMDSQGMYNKANRPNWARETGALGVAGTIAFTFKQYSIAYVEFLKRLYGDGLLPKKSFLLALGMLALAAGSEGLPGADDLDDLLETIAAWLGIPLNMKKEKRKFLQETLGFGPGMTEYMMHGVSAGLPFDVAARLGAQNLVPGTALFNPTKQGPFEKTYEALEVLGPAGGFAKTVTEGARKFVGGEFAEAGKTVLPKALRDLVQGTEMLATGKMRDQRGRVSMEATPVEAISKAVGFNPERSARESRVIDELRTDQEIVTTTKTELQQKLAKAIAERDSARREELMREWQEWNRKYPDYRFSLNWPSINKQARDMEKSRTERFIKGSPRQMRQQAREALLPQE